MASNSFTTPLPPLDAELARIRLLLEAHRPQEALNNAQALLARDPGNRDILYLVAVSERHVQRIPLALTVLEELERLHPRFSRLYQERGHCYVGLRDAPKAIEAFLKAVNMNPALPASWRALESLYRMVGQPENAGTATAHLATLAKLPPDVLIASALFADGDLVLAESTVRDYLLKHGNHVEGMRLLARIGIALEVFDDAETLLAGVVELAPDYRAARHDYATALTRRHKHAEALAQLEILLREEPGNRAFRITYATATVGSGDHEKALRLYRELLTDAPQAADIQLSVAHSLKTLGRRDEAIEAYRTTAAIRPSYGDAYWSLANLKTYRFTDAEIAQMRHGEGAPDTSLVDRYHLCFALGKALEDAGAYEEAFRYYDRGNTLKRTEVSYSPAILEATFARQKMICTRDFFESRRAAGYLDSAPIFIVGLPRSGSTLLEQILASHSRVEGTMELADVARVAHQLSGRQADAASLYPAVLGELAVDKFAEFGRNYINDTKIYRTGKDHFVDKMPNNFRHLGLIHLMLPEAKIIDARRAPMACCFSNFKQLFASGQEFTYSIEDIARYYRSYVDLMEHWNRALPGKILRVDHETLVDDFENTVRRVLDFCNLRFEPGCLEFYKTERSVRTASSEQVRQPINKDGIDQWRHFEPWLGPLKAALGDLGHDA